MKPDDDHTCMPMYDEQGNLTAVVHGDPGISDEARVALADVIAAARRLHAIADADGELSRRQAAGRERIRERNARLFGRDEDDG